MALRFSVGISVFIAEYELPLTFNFHVYQGISKAKILRLAEPKARKLCESHKKTFVRIEINRLPHGLRVEP